MRRAAALSFLIATLLACTAAMSAGWLPLGAPTATYAPSGEQFMAAGIAGNTTTLPAIELTGPLQASGGGNISDGCQGVYSGWYLANFNSSYTYSLINGGFLPPVQVTVSGAAETDPGFNIGADNAAASNGTLRFNLQPAVTSANTPLSASTGINNEYYVGTGNPFTNFGWVHLFASWNTCGSTGYSTVLVNGSQVIAASETSPGAFNVNYSKPFGAQIGFENPIVNNAMWGNVSDIWVDYTHSLNCTAVNTAGSSPNTISDAYCTGSNNGVVPPDLVAKFISGGKPVAINDATGKCKLPFGYQPTLCFTAATPSVFLTNSGYGGTFSQGVAASGASEFSTSTLPVTESSLKIGPTGTQSTFAFCSAGDSTAPCQSDTTTACHGTFGTAQTCTVIIDTSGGTTAAKIKNTVGNFLTALGLASVALDPNISNVNYGSEGVYQNIVFQYKTVGTGGNSWLMTASASPASNITTTGGGSLHNGFGAATTFFAPSSYGPAGIPANTVAQKWSTYGTGATVSTSAQNNPIVAGDFLVLAVLGTTATAGQTWGAPTTVGGTWAAAGALNGSGSTLNNAGCCGVYGIFTAVATTGDGTLNGSSNNGVYTMSASPAGLTHAAWVLIDYGSANGPTLDAASAAQINASSTAMGITSGNAVATTATNDLVVFFAMTGLTNKGPYAGPTTSGWNHRWSNGPIGGSSATPLIAVADQVFAATGATGAVAGGSSNSATPTVTMEIAIKHN